MNRQSVPNATVGYPGRPANGGSNPRFYDFDDCVPRLVKWHPSGHGPKASYNELVASRLGQLTGAPILRGLVIYVPDDIIPDDHRATGAHPGFHFGVTRMDGDNFVPAQHYGEIENLSELPFAAVHLAWLDVGDQESHNQFLQQLERRQPDGSVRKTRLFKLIDMGQMFGRFDWTAATAAQVPDGYSLPPHMAERLTFDKLGPAIAQLRQIDQAQIEECFDACPDDWGIPSDDRRAGTDRVLKVRDRIEDRIRQGNPNLK